MAIADWFLRSGNTLMHGFAELGCFVREARSREPSNAARKLIQMFQTSPALMSCALWTAVAGRMRQPHSDIHNDNSHRSSDCESYEHTDIGIGLGFPPYPPDLT